MNLHSHKSELEAKGITKIPALIDVSKINTARDQLLELSKSHGVLDGDHWYKSDLRFGLSKTFRSALNRLTKSERFPQFIDEAILNVAQALVGQEVTPLAPGQQLLFTLPGTESWFVPTDVWHLDLPRLKDPGIPGVQAFTFLDRVELGGGGTLVLAGSHHLLNDQGFIRSKDIKKQLMETPYFKWLFDKNRGVISDFRDTKGVVEGQTLSVMEMTGEPGDVYFMDLRALHTPAPNASDTARMMLTCRLPKADQDIENLFKS